MSYEMIEMEIIRASETLGIIPHGNLQEIIEGIQTDALDLKEADLTNDPQKIKRSLGILVGELIVYCALKDISLTKCLEEAEDYFN